MIIDVHCHIGYSARRVRGSTADPADAATRALSRFCFLGQGSSLRFSFEPDGAEGAPGLDSYLSTRLLRRPAWFFVRRWLGVAPDLGPGVEMDARIDEIHRAHWFGAESVDRMVLLAFDEYRDEEGCVIGPARPGCRFGSDLYASNSLVRAVCAEHPERFLFGASVHPYRPGACAMLEEVVAAGAVLVKWLPIHQNIRADDPRTVAFLRKAAELGTSMLIHYGGEMSLSRQHMEFEPYAPMSAVLHRLRREGTMPTVIVAHVATPSFAWQACDGFDLLCRDLLGDLADAPLYADISALAAFGRTTWLKHIAGRPELHSKLVWGSDYPIPVLTWPFRRFVDRAERRRLAALPSWIEQDLQLKRAMGLPDSVFHRAGELLLGRRGDTRGEHGAEAAR